MCIFDKYSAPKQWYCQWRFGCILFALINSGMIDNSLFKWIKPNDNLREKPLEKRILFEPKIMAIWALITGFYPFGHKETFHTIYSAFMKLLKAKSKIDTATYKKKVLRFSKKLCELEGYFSENDGKSLCDGTWKAGKILRLYVEDFSSVEDLPFKSLVCEDGKHWVVHLGTKDGYAILLDSRICDGFVHLPISELCGCKIIKRKNIKIDSERLWILLSDFEKNPAQMLHNLRRQEFSRKITKLICMIDEINFTERDYNRFVKLGKSFLEKLDKEHHKYEL